MAKVTGLGGVFLHARDPKQLTAWYAEHPRCAPAYTINGEALQWKLIGIRLERCGQACSSFRYGLSG